MVHGCQLRKHAFALANRATKVGVLTIRADCGLSLRVQLTALGFLRADIQRNEINWVKVIDYWRRR